MKEKDSIKIKKEKDPIKIKFGRRLKEIRKKRGYSREQLATEICKKKGYNIEISLNTTINSINKWESGTQRPNDENILILCDILDCDIDYLFERREESTIDIALIRKYTGLSEDAIEVLHNNLYYITSNKLIGSHPNNAELLLNSINHLLTETTYGQKLLCNIYTFLTSSSSRIVYANREKDVDYNPILSLCDTQNETLHLIDINDKLDDLHIMGIIGILNNMKKDLSNSKRITFSSEQDFIDFFKAEKKTEQEINKVLFQEPLIKMDIPEFDDKM